ncbi:MAG: hypothetical protein D4S01_04110 [Dehalococcoidia bacterium]|nr:MAG: hypothetical protein D4S01_04110 [Dehalococcoidia bacterium]
MNLLLKKYNVALILAIMLALSFAQMATVHSTETADLNEVLVFLGDVVNLDVTKYDVELLGTTVSHPAELGGLTQITGKYTLQSKTSKLDVLFKFRNNTLSWCLLRVLEGSPHYKIQSSTNVRDNAIDFLQRYQTYTGDSELETMKNMLDTVDATKNTTKTTDNVKITVTNTAESTSFEWKHSFNGADYAGMTVSFRNGSFYSFSDKRNIYTIGSTDVNISKEEAIILSYKYVENLTWTIGDEEVTDFNIVEEGTDPELLTRSRDEPLKLYPYWYVLLYLDDLYSGNVRHIQVMFWADTGELIDCQPLSLGGGSSQELTNTEPPSTTEQSASLSTKQNEDASHLTYTPIISAVAATIIAIAIVTAIRKKKHK